MLFLTAGCDSADGPAAARRCGELGGRFLTTSVESGVEGAVGAAPVLFLTAGTCESLSQGLDGEAVDGEVLTADTCGSGSLGFADGTDTPRLCRKLGGKFLTTAGDSAAPEEIGASVLATRGPASLAFGSGGESARLC